MNSHPKISVIVPVYNTAQYLPRCIDSILSQSFSDFELLLVDDGSTDGSGAVCDAYAEKNGRIRVFHKENGGVSSARNLGIDKAQGEWIYFADSDDEILPDGLQVLVNNISDEVDVVMGGFEEVDEEGRVSWEAGRIESFRLSKKQSAITLFTGYGIGCFYMGYTWMRLFRNSLIRQMGLRFDTQISIKEDALFTMQYVCRSNGITQYTTRPIYRYYKRPNSAMGKTMRGFDLKYVSSFYALVDMKHEVETVFPPFSEVVHIARQGIYGRYDTIMGKMKASHIENHALQKELDSIMHKEMGSILFFKLRRKWRKLLKKQKSYEL